MNAHAPDDKSDYGSGNCSGRNAENEPRSFPLRPTSDPASATNAVGRLVRFEKFHFRIRATRSNAIAKIQIVALARRTCV